MLLSTSSALEDDLEPSIYQGMLPSFSGLEFLYSAGLNSNSFSLEEHVKILLVAEFFRMISSEMLTDWPPVLFEPQLIELALLVPNTSFSPLYVFLVSQLVQLLRTNSIISMIELQGSLDEMLIPKVILSNCSASQKLEVLVQLLDQVTQLPWFFKWLDDKASFSATLAQKKRDLLIARDANNHNVHSAKTELAHFQARAGYLKEQALLDPSNDFVSMQLKAIDVQITTQRDKLDNFLSRRDELQTWIQEIESTEFTTPGAALLHGQLEGPISDTFVTLLGKDRIGRLFWFWRPIGGIFIEANSCPGLDFPSNTPRWEHVGDKTQFEVLLRSLNPRGHRERILQAQLSTNQKLILDSFSSANRWLQLQRELIALADEQLAPYITAKFAEYRPHLEKLNDAFLARLKNFGADDLLAMFDRSHYDFFVLRAMRERLAKLKLYLYDQSALLFKSSQRGNTGQRLLDALHNADTLEKGVQAAHAMFDFTVPLLEACKGLNTSLTLHEKELKHSLGILFTWIKSSPYFKDILIAATGNPRAKFPTADHFCSWLTRVIDYLTDLHQDNIDDDCLIKQRKFRGLKTQTCHTHSSFDSCHYHCSSLPKSTIVEVHIPRRLESFKNAQKISSSTAYSTQKCSHQEAC
ncbi:hypothetical protein L0F63_005979 [Massospora cicadina]|nr:hypothetical protein L0F63_005979 [Massospora cicadina]